MSSGGIGSIVLLEHTSCVAPSGPTEPVQLFNGKDLEGWEGAGEPAEKCWQVRDEWLECTGAKGPWLRTKEEFGDFNLEFEVKVDAALNSGVQIRSHSLPGYQNGRVHGYQVEIDPSDRAWTGGLYDEARQGHRRSSR